jgi:O-methyltransferase
MKPMISIRALLNRFANRLGYQVTRTQKGLPPASHLLVLFQNLANGYAVALERERGIKLAAEDEVRNRLMARLLGTQPTEAFEIIAGLAATSNEPGDVCEFGVAQGETSALIAEHIRADGRHLHLYDSFEGLPTPTAKDVLIHDIFELGSMGAYAGTMSVPVQVVRARLGALEFPSDRVTIHEGFVDADFADSGQLPDQVSFAYVDFDLYEPIKIVLAAIQPRLTRGAIVIVDDYGWFSAGAKQAVDEFVKSHSSFECMVPDTRVGHFAILRYRTSGVGSAAALRQGSVMS